MAKKGNDISKERLLYVEGPNDKWVLISLKDQYGHPEDDIYIGDKGNCDKAITAFGTTISNPIVTKRLGIIVDADTDISSARQKIITELHNNNISIAENELTRAGGYIKDIVNQSSSPLRIGVWIMPDNINAGRLEDFLFKKINPVDDLFVQVDPALISLEETAKVNAKVAEKMYTQTHRDKAKLHTYISWSTHPDVSMGIAVKANLFPIESAEEKLFKNWLEELFYT